MGELKLEDIEMEKGRVVEADEADQERYAHLLSEKRPDLRFAVLREKVAAQLKTEGAERNTKAAKEPGNGLDRLVRKVSHRTKKPDLTSQSFKLVLHSDNFAEHVLTISRSVLPTLFPQKRHTNRNIPAPSPMSMSPPDVLLTRAINENQLRHLSDGPRGGVWVVEGRAGEGGGCGAFCAE